MKTKKVFASCNLHVCLAASLLFFSSLAAMSQTGGAPTTSVYDTHAIDSVNLQNLNVMLNVQVLSKSGAMPFSLSLSASSGCVVYGSGTSHSTACGLLQLINKPVGSEPIWAGFVPSVHALLNGNTNTPVIGASTSTTVGCPSNNVFTQEYSGWWIQTNDGTKHFLPPGDMVDSLGCFSSSLSDQAIDGSGYTLMITGSTQGNSLCNPGAGTGSNCTIYEAGGAAINVVPQTTQSIYFSTMATDSNGNSISFNAGTNTYIDTLNLTAITEDNSANPSVFSWDDINGNQQKATIGYSALNVQAISDCTTTGAGTQPGMPTSISFPNGGSLGIAYEPNAAHSGTYTGRLATLTLPTGGTITYTYPGAFNCSYMVPSKVTRQTADGTTTYTWAPFQNGNTTTVVDQGGNTTIYTFTGLAAAGSTPSPTTAQVVTQIQRFQGTSTLLTTDVYCYNAASGQPGNCSTAVVSLPIKEIDVYHTINGMSSSSRSRVTYDSYGNVTSSTAWDFGFAFYTRQTTTTYGSWNGSACVAIGNHINNKPCDVQTTSKDIKGNLSVIAESRYTYDSHGNLLTTYKWTGTQWLSNATPNVYNANGTIATSYDLANTPTSYGYGNGCNNLFPTSVTAGGLTIYKTWNCTGGVLLTSSNPNNSKLVTTYGYASKAGQADPYWRVMSTTDPLGNTVYKTYGMNTLETSLSFGSSMVDAVTTFDGYGRSIRTQKNRNDNSGNYDTGSISYGWTGAFHTVSSTMPCAVAQGSDCTFSSGATVSQLDPLGRSQLTTDGGGGTVTSTYAQNDVLTVLGPAPSGEKVKQVQKQYDGLGRLQLSCAIGNGSTTACGQNTGTANGVTTAYAYGAASGSTTVTATRGVQSRGKTYDALGRLISETNPESGTTTYTYDSVPPPGTCGGWTSQPGELMVITNANGTSTCQVHDALHRLIRTGTNQTPNTCKSLIYDSVSNALQAQPPNSTFSNLAGRLVEAETDNCTAWPPTSASMITDEWFSYDADGRLTDVYESTLHSGGYYHTTVSYFANGAVSSLSGLPGYAAYTYTADGEGRPNTAVQGTTKLINGVTYNAASQPQIVNIGGSGDQDTYTYDPATGRMKTYTFEINSVSETGTLKWNANGSLQQLAIVDGFDSGGTQTCNYLYDDLGRIGTPSGSTAYSVDCGFSLWRQTFTYDQYGNLTKTGNPGITWNPGYNSANNQYSLVGASYDASGNLLYDTFDTYTWDSYGKMASVRASNSAAVCGTSGTCVTYDALGRAVETNASGSYTEILYSPIGKTAIMNGQTVNFAYVPLPGRESSLYAAGTGGGGHYMEHHDWRGDVVLRTTLNNRTMDYDRAFAPYGEAYANFGNTSKLNFTGDTQDIFAGLFDTPNRELNPTQGRWISPDPAGAGWNLYAYSANPNSAIDPSGLFPKQEPSGCSPAVGCPTGGAIGDYNNDGGPYGYNPLNFMDAFPDLVFGTVPANITSSVTKPSSSPTGPAFCGCPDDLTSGAMAGTVAPLPDGISGPVGCSGAGVPCYLSQQGPIDPTVGSLTMQGTPGYGAQASYVYVVRDILGNPTTVGSVSEDLTVLAMSSNSIPPTSSTWSGPDDLPSGLYFKDNVWTWGPLVDSSSVAIFLQTFTASVGGNTFALINQNMNVVAYGPGGPTGSIGVARSNQLTP